MTTRCAYTPGMTRHQKMRPAFYDLHAVTLDRHATRDQLAEALRAAEAVTDRHRLSEGAVYASGCRRWLLDTGTPWTREGDTTPSWGASSDHRLRVLDDDHATQSMFRCSCGEDGTWVRGDSYGTSHRLAVEQHAAHVAEATGVPA